MCDVKISINKEEIPKLPPVEYDGGIRVIETADDARVALRELSRASLVGFDTETRPSFKKGVTHKVALMQLATDDFCFLFRLNKLGISDYLKDFLENERIVKIGVSVHDDFKALGRSREINPGGFIDLQDYVKQFGIIDNSLQKIYAVVFGKYISKGQRLTNWEAAELTSHQQRYAAIDAWASLELYKYLAAGNFDPALSPYRIEPLTVD